MFSEAPLSSVCSIQPVLSTSTTSDSRTSTMTSNSYSKTDGSSPFQQLNRQMKIGKYLLEKTIGKGNFAVVKLATHSDTQQKVAIKIIDKSCLDPGDRRKLEREISVMKSLVHPFIIRLYEVMESKNLIYLVTEYAANGELLDLLIHEKRLSEPKAKEKFYQLVLAVEYIHSKNVVHRDLKAENLLLDGRGNIKVADFGFANVYEPDSMLKTFCGSLPYAAPELYRCQPYSPEKVDVWSLGVLLYVFVCGHLPFDNNNLGELRKRVVSGQFRLPFYISSDCGSLISHMLTVDPNQRYTISDIKKHPWLAGYTLNMSDLTCQTQSIPNCQLTNAILDHAESLGYNRTQILKSVNGNSYDSDAAIWHILLDQFQHICQIDNSHIPIKPMLNNDTNSPDLIRRSTAPIIFDANNTELVYCAPNKAESIRPQLDPCDLQRTSQQTIYSRQEPEIRIDYLDSDDDNNNEDVDDDIKSAQLREQYIRTHGIRRHTVGRPDLLLHGGPMPNLTSKVLFAHQSSSLEPSLLTTRLTNLLQQQQQQQFETISTPNDNNNNDDDTDDHNQSLSFYHQNNTQPNYNTLSVYSPRIQNTLDVNNNQQLNNHWLSPPVLNNFHMNRRASDSGANLLLFHQQYGVTASNTLGAVRPTQIQSSLSNRSSRGSITRGAPITPPTFSTTSHTVEEDKNEDQNDYDDDETLQRYLNRGKRHTVCEQGLLLSGKTRRSGNRESTKDRGLSSRRASDTSSHFISGTARAHLERLYNNAVNLKTSDEDLTTSSLQELQKLQKQVQKYPTNNSDFSTIRRTTSTVPSPTNSIGLQMIQEEHQQNPSLLSNNGFSNQKKSPSISSSSSSASSERLTYDDERDMDCDVHHYHPQQGYFNPSHYHPPQSLLYYNTGPLIAQHLAIPTTTASYIP